MGESRAPCSLEETLCAQHGGVKETHISEQQVMCYVHHRGKSRGHTIESENHSQSLKWNGISPARVQTFLGPMIPFFLLIATFWNGDVYLMPVP